MLGSTLQDLPSDSPTACRSACRGRRASPRTGSHQRTILACTRPVLVGHAVELAMPNHLPTTTARSTPTLGWPSSACASFERQAPTQADDEPGMDAAGDHADPDHPSRTAACPPPRSRTSLRPDTGDAATHRHRTPTPDAGQRTPGRSDARTGHWTPVTWTGKRGHWSLAPDTGHWTPDAGRGRGQVTKARPASGPRPPRRATARWDAQPCSCGRRLRRSTAHAGSAVRPPSQREIASRRQLLGRSAGVERRLGALLSSDDYGSSVERTAKLHPLWQGARRDRHKLEQARSGFDQGVVSELRAVYSGVRCAGVGWRRRGE
jgi:hypothetical protein